MLCIYICISCVYHVIASNEMFSIARKAVQAALIPFCKIVLAGGGGGGQCAPVINGSGCNGGSKVGRRSVGGYDVHM